MSKKKNKKNMKAIDVEWDYLNNPITLNISEGYSMFSTFLCESEVEEIITKLSETLADFRANKKTRKQLTGM